MPLWDKHLRLDQVLQEDRGHQGNQLDPVKGEEGDPQVRGSEVAPGDLQSTGPFIPLATWGDAMWSKIPIPYPQTQSQFTSQFCVFSNFILLQLSAALQPGYTKLQYLHREFHLVFHK